MAVRGGGGREGSRRGKEREVRKKVGNCGY